MAYSEHQFGISVLSTPVYWLTGSTVVAYNAALLLSFPLCGLAAYLLAYELTGRRDASWIAGLAFAFAPYRLDHLSHVQVLSSYWMPLGLFALHRYYRDPRVRWLGLFSLCTLMTGLCNGYYLLFYPVLVVLWVLWFTPNEGWWRRVSAVGLAGALAVLLLAPTLLTYQRVHDRFGFVRSAGEIREFSADVSGLLSGPTRSVLWRFPDGVQRSEGQLFPGLTVAVLIAIGLWQVRWRPQGPEPAALRVLRWAVGVPGILLALGLLVRVVAGPWEIAPLGIEISVDRPANIIAQGMLFWVFSLVLSPVGAWAYRRHSVFAFYCLAAFVLFVFSLGPEPKAFGHDFMAHSAYKALMWLPGFDGLRVPARFWMLVTICLSVLAALGFTRATSVVSTARWRHAVLVLATAGMMGDGWVVWPAPVAPVRTSLLDGMRGVVLELPLNFRYNDQAAMLRSASHRQPLVNGFSGYSPAYYQLLGSLIARERTAALDVLAGLGVRYVRIDRVLDTASRLESFVQRYPGARLVTEADDEVLFEIPSRADLTRPIAYGPSVEIATVWSSVNSDYVSQVLDGDLETRWEGGPQEPGQQLEVTLSETTSIGAVVMQLGPYRTDHPRGLVVQLSADGVAWEEVWRGRTDMIALVGAFQRPRELPVVIPLAGRVGRFIRLRTTRRSPVYYWSIAELSVLSPAP